MTRWQEDMKQLKQGSPVRCGYCGSGYLDTPEEYQVQNGQCVDCFEKSRSTNS